jgi:hypothetical protein
MMLKIPLKPPLEKGEVIPPYKRGARGLCLVQNICHDLLRVGCADDVPTIITFVQNGITCFGFPSEFWSAIQRSAEACRCAEPASS